MKPETSITPDADQENHTDDLDFIEDLRVIDQHLLGAPDDIQHEGLPFLHGSENEQGRQNSSPPKKRKGP